MNTTVFSEESSFSLKGNIASPGCKTTKDSQEISGIRQCKQSLWAMAWPGFSMCEIVPYEVMIV